MKHKLDGLLRLVSPWRVREEGELLQTKVFTVRQRHCTSRANPDKAGLFYYLDCGDWVNVVALTATSEVVMIEQFRHGTKEVTLELPGGMVDPGEKPLTAAMRELAEESGFSGAPAHLIGSVTPNPAILNNRCHTALVENATQTSDQQLDGNEEIAVRMVPLAEVPGLIRSGIIHHSLVIAAFYHQTLWESVTLNSR